MTVTAGRFALLLLGALVALPASAAVLLAGYGSAGSEDAARAAAREDLAVRLERAVAANRGAERSGLVEGRELPLIGVESVSAAGPGGRRRYEARLTDASLAEYGRAAADLAQRLRKRGPAPASPDERQFAEVFAQLDQERRIAAVLRLFSRPVPETSVDESALERLAAKSLSPVSDSKEVAKRVKAALERDRIAGVRVVAPVRAENSEITGLSGRIADDLRRELGPLASDRVARYSLDGTYRAIGGKILLKLYLLDAGFGTARGFAFVLPEEKEGRAPSSASGFAQTLSRGLVRVDLPDAGAAPATGGAAMSVDVQTDRGRRGLYYRPGDRDRLLVKLDRPGYYYVVGHVEKANARLSYLMEIGEQATGSRFVRRVGPEEVGQWQPIGQFTVEPPIGLEAVQVFATSENPERALPAARFDPARKLYVIGTDPGEAVKRSRGLVRVEMGGDAGRPGAGSSAVGEAVLQFMTLQ
jgi:hypothetical protein